MAWYSISEVSKFTKAQKVCHNMPCQNIQVRTLTYCGSPIRVVPMKSNYTWVTSNQWQYRAYIHYQSARCSPQLTTFDCQILRGNTRNSTVICHILSLVTLKAWRKPGPKQHLQSTILVSTPIWGQPVCR